MKLKLLSFILCCFAITACDNDEKETSVKNSSITKEGILSGVIEPNSTIGTSGSIYCVELENNNEIGITTVDEGGKFSCQLANLPAGSLSELNTDVTEGIIISDPSAKGGNIETYFKKHYTDNDYYKLIKTNFNLSDYSSYADIINGIYVSSFMYFDKDVKVSGTYNDVEDNTQFTLDMELKKGWNEVVTYTTVNASTLTTVMKMTTTIPAGMKWYVYSEDELGGMDFAPQKIKINSLPFNLFRK